MKSYKFLKGVRDFDFEENKDGSITVTLKEDRISTFGTYEY